MLIHRTSSWCSFLDCVKLAAIFWARCSCKFAAHSSLFHMSIIANTSAAKKQFGTRKCWVWALQGCARLFCTIPSFRIDHSRITELYIRTHKLPPKLIIYQLAYIDWNIIILPALGTAIPLRMDQFAGHSPSALVENSNKSFFSPRFSTSAVHFVNPESSSSSLIERKRRMHTSVVPHHSKNKPF